MDTGRRKPSLWGRLALGGIYLNLTHYGRLAGKKLVGLQLGFFALHLGLRISRF